MRERANTPRSGGGPLAALGARLAAALPGGRTLPLRLWRHRHRALRRLLWTQVLLVPAVGMAYSGYAPGHSALHAVPIAGFALLATRALPRRAASAVVAGGLLTSSAMLVHATGGLVEAHFHFFVVMALLALYEDWAPYALAFAYVVLHHGVVGMLFPQHVYEHGGPPWAWAIVHAGFIGAAGVANLISWRMNEAVRVHAYAQARGRANAEVASRTLREALVPGPLPALSCARVAARYGTGEGDVGGDWFEVVELPDGRIGVGLGDVAGRGVSAAVMTSKLRHTLSAHAGEGMAPAEVLRRLDRIVHGSFATAAYAIVSPAEETVTISSAGHPPPLVIAPDGSAAFAERQQGPPLAGFGSDFPETAIPFPAGSTLVLYSDGLFERRDELLDDGLERLREQADGIVEPPEALCSRLLFGMQDGERADDTALVALQTANPAAPATVTVPAAPEHVTALRRSAAKWARAGGVADAQADGLALAVGEAAANSVTHSGSATVELELRTAGDTAEAVVRDFGTWRERPASAEHPDPASGGDVTALVPRGRGLALMGALAATDVDARPGGTSVTLRVPLATLAGAAVEPSSPDRSTARIAAAR